MPDPVQRTRSAGTTAVLRRGAPVSVELAGLLDAAMGPARPRELRGEDRIRAEYARIIGRGSRARNRGPSPDPCPLRGRPSPDGPRRATMVSMERQGRGRRAPRARVGILALATMASVVGGLSTTAGASTRDPVDSTTAGVPLPNQGENTVNRVTGRSTSNSRDWAGYAVTGTTVSSVTGTWVQPAVTCPGNKFEQSAFWVGIDGFASTDPTVQQIGTDGDCAKGSHKNPGGASYYAWYEMYPASLVVLDPTSHPVNPGDVLTGSVAVSGPSYVLTLTDAGHWSYSTTQTPAAPALDLSAEWIAEAPSTCTSATSCKPVKLSNFGAVAFTGATVNGGPLAAPGLNVDQITMTKNKKGTIVKASTSLLTLGSSFSVAWLSS
jgi:hypothetical protein